MDELRAEKILTEIKHVLKEGKREFDTWLREKGNMAKLNVCTYPGSFVKEK